MFGTQQFCVWFFVYRVFLVPLFCLSEEFLFVVPETVNIITRYSYVRNGMNRLLDIVTYAVRSESCGEAVSQAVRVLLISLVAGVVVPAVLCAVFSGCTVVSLALTLDA